VDEFRNEPLDLVVTVCDLAAENCPVWLGKRKRVHLGFTDPAKSLGTEDDVMVVFRKVREDMPQKVPDLLSNV